MYIKSVIKFFENVAKLKFWRMTVTNQNYILDKIKGILNLGNTCCHAVQSFTLPYAAENLTFKMQYNPNNPS
jgi:hypothetical protein